MIQSIIQKRGQVQFPEFSAERIYMLPFFQNEGLPSEFNHWQSTVDSMLMGIETEEPIYLMVDQAFVKGGNAHRRPGMHVDGYWGGTAHRGQGHGGHRISAHGGTPNHGGAPLTHGGQPADAYWKSDKRHSASTDGGWDVIDLSAPEGIILASNIQACVGYTGLYDEQLLGKGGDASHIKGHFNRIDMEANHVYAGNVAMLHESLPVSADSFRTVVRLNVPGWTPTQH